MFNPKLEHQSKYPFYMCRQQAAMEMKSIQSIKRNEKAERVCLGGTGFDLVLRFGSSVNGIMLTTQPPAQRSSHNESYSHVNEEVNVNICYNNIAIIKLN